LTSIEVFLWAQLSGEAWRSTGVKVGGVLEVAKPAIPLGDAIGLVFQQVQKYEKVSGVRFARLRSSWSPPLGSAGSAAGRPALFVRLVATMAESDFTTVVHHRLRLLAFPMRT